MGTIKGPYGLFGGSRLILAQDESLAMYTITVCDTCPQCCFNESALLTPYNYADYIWDILCISHLPFCKGCNGEVFRSHNKCVG